MISRPFVTRLIGLLCGALLAGSTAAQAQPPSPAPAPPPTLCKSANCIVTGGPKGTYFHMANDLQRHAAPDLSVLQSNGSYDNLQRLAAERGVSFALVQADVLNYVNLLIRSEPDAARAAEFRTLVSPLQVMMPLYEEELHVLVHKDSKLRYLHEIESQRIFMGRVNSGSYITGKSVYELMFRKALGDREVNAQRFNKGSSGEEIDAALVNLGRLPQGTPEPAVDVVILVGGQPYSPVRNLEKSKALASQFRFLTLDPNHSTTRRLLERYRGATLRSKEYTEITQGRDTATLGVPAYLVTSAFIDDKRTRFVVDFAAQYCKNFEALASDPASHSKWREVIWKPGSMPPKLLPGWRSVPPPVVAALTRCSAPPEQRREPAAQRRPGSGPCFPNPRDPTKELC